MNAHATLIILGIIGSILLGSIGRRMEVRLSEDDKPFWPGFCQFVAALLLIMLAIAALLFVPEMILVKQQIQDVLSDPTIRRSEWWRLLAIILVAPIVYSLLTILFYLSGLRGLRRWHR